MCKGMLQEKKEEKEYGGVCGQRQGKVGAGALPFYSRSNVPSLRREEGPSSILEKVIDIQANEERPSSTGHHHRPPREGSVEAAEVPVAHLSTSHPSPCPCSSLSPLHSLEGALGG